MFVSGRIHGAVAALSQSVPTVIIDYGHEPKAHKLKGFAAVVNVSEYVAEPEKIDDLYNKMILCWKNKNRYQTCLNNKMHKVKELAKLNFKLLKSL